MQKKAGILFLDYLDFQIVKINSFYEVVLGKTHPVVPTELLDGGIQPNRRTEVETMSDFIQGMEDFVCPGIIAVVADDCIPDQTVVFENFGP